MAEWLGLDTCGDAALERMVSDCMIWGNAFRDNQEPRWLTLVGPSGTGKTHCAKRLFRWAANRSDWTNVDYQNRVIYWPDFVQALRAGNAFEERDDLKRWPVLCLDDIGSERDPSGFATEELHTLLGRREGKWTIITSNLAVKNFAQIDKRIADRIVRKPNIKCEVETTSYALRK